MATNGPYSAGRARTVVAVTVACLPLVHLLVVHAAVLPGRVSAVGKANRDGQQQTGPTSPSIAPIFAAVAEETGPDDVVAFYRARLMTMLTERRAIQTTDLELVRQRADYFAQQRRSDYSQPDITEAEARALGFVAVWSDRNWVLWRLPPP